MFCFAQSKSAGKPVIHLSETAKFPGGGEVNHAILAHWPASNSCLISAYYRQFGPESVKKSPMSKDYDRYILTCETILPTTRCRHRENGEGSTMTSFDEFFEKATENPPYGYQTRLARDGLPAVLRAPTGSGKTGVVLAWLWRRLHGPTPDAVPRRLIYALPQRSLVEQVAGEAAGWLDRLGLSGEVALHVVMGGEDKTGQWDWRRNMHRPAIVVGTVDSLVSKALNRGYGVGRAIYPIDFALVTNGSQWIIDEIQLCPESTTTLRQLAAFTTMFGTAEPFALTCMSATVPEDLLDTVDNPGPVTDVLRIEESERVGELARRLSARRFVRRLAVEAGDAKAIAQAVGERHRAGSLTLVVVNTVETARAIHSHLRRQPVPCTLLHSRFRGQERQELIGRVIAKPTGAGHIVVATQVVEAGIDIDAAVLVVEAGPWPSVVQRAGRCNRRGLLDDAEMWWLPPAKHPYEQADVDASVAELTALEGTAGTSEDLLSRTVFTTPAEVTALRKADLVTLFDTAPDLDGADLDVAPYVRDAEDLDVQVAWATWEVSTKDGAPPYDAEVPESRWRCRVPLGVLSVLIKKGTPVWRFDQVLGRWAKVTSQQAARPGEVLIIAATDGGYDPESGLDPSGKTPVPGCPSLSDSREPDSGAYRQDAASVWQEERLSLTRHSEETRDHARGLLDVQRPSITEAMAAAIVTAAYVHDVGKSHPIWQDALCALASPEDKEEVAGGRPWAKSSDRGRLEFAGGVQFRHELASLLLIDGPLRDLVSTVEELDLLRYLVLAHHGKLRIQVRGPNDSDKNVLLGLRQDASVAVPPILGLPAGELIVDLAPFDLGGDRSWTRTALSLRDRYGPFVLAYLETVVRIADWRASGQAEVAR